MKRLRWVPVVAYAGLIFFLSSRAWREPPFELFYGADKVIHAIMYAGLAFGLVWAFRATRWKFNPHLFWVAALISLAYGASDEFHQSFVEGRTASIADLIADGIGGCVGAYAAIVVARFIRKEPVPARMPKGSDVS